MYDKKYDNPDKVATITIPFFALCESDTRETLSNYVVGVVTQQKAREEIESLKGKIVDSVLFWNKPLTEEQVEEMREAHKGLSRQEFRGTDVVRKAYQTLQELDSRNCYGKVQIPVTPRLFIGEPEFPAGAEECERVGSLWEEIQRCGTKFHEAELQLIDMRGMARSLERDMKGQAREKGLVDEETSRDYRKVHEDISDMLREKKLWRRRLAEEFAKMFEWVTDYRIKVLQF